MAIHFTCDGIRRRDVLKVGMLGMGSLTLANYLKLANAGQIVKKPKVATSAIFVNLSGGPSHMDTFDCKPNAPKEFRGEFNTIKTNVAGIEISEYLPYLAKQMGKFVILRGVSHSLAAHELGSQYVNTGNRPIPSLEFPAYGSVVTRELKGKNDLPSFVAVPNGAQKAGYLGVQYAALNTGTTPKPATPYSVRGVSLQNGVTVADVERRTKLLHDLDDTFRGYEQDSQLLQGMDKFSQQAHEIITSSSARKAFDVSQESPAFAKPYGETPFGMSCLLATRLIESGVRFVTLTYGGWDTHNDNWARLRDKLLPPFDQGLAALFHGLHQKGLLDTTAVYVTGEFGRTPKINERAGRDHFARNMFMLMAGGGISGGRVLGESDEKGMAPKSDGIKPDDVAASFYHNLGIDPHKEYHTSTGRPVMIVREGNVIPKLFA